MAALDALPQTLRAPTEAAAAARADLSAWASNHGGHRVNPLALIGELGERLTAAGIALWRIACTLGDYHPEVIGRQYNWVRDKGTEQINRQYTPILSETFTASPIYVIREGASALRRRLAGPKANLDFPVLKELAAEGGTDYLALPLVFSDGARYFISFATDRPDGFRDDELAYLEALVPQVSLRIEIEHARQLADQVLEVYLGRYAAPRVLSGEVRRVRGHAIPAIILAVDMRGFTHLTDTLDADAVFGTLSVFYDAIADPVLAAGGDVVKMIADGILAVFPVPPEADEEARRMIAWGAADAVRDALAALTALTPEDLPNGAWPLRAGFALHAGEITFGNVGSRARLDFTLIGPAVNEAFRIEAMTKALKRPILLSADFAKLLSLESVVSLGFHELRGVRDAKELFGLAPMPRQP